MLSCSSQCGFSNWDVFGSYFTRVVDGCMVDVYFGFDWTQQISYSRFLYHSCNASFGKRLCILVIFA